MNEIAKIAVQSWAVTRIGVEREILDGYDAKLADFCEGVKFRWPERIGSIAIKDFHALTLRKEVSLPGIAGEGRGHCFWALATLRIQMVRPVFGFTELCQFCCDVCLRLRATSSSSARFPSIAGKVRLPLRIAEIVNFESIQSLETLKGSYGSQLVAEVVIDRRKGKECMR